MNLKVIENRKENGKCLKRYKNLEQKMISNISQQCSRKFVFKVRLEYFVILKIEYHMLFGVLLIE